MNITIQMIRERPELRETATDWFASKWGIPRVEYEKSFADCFAAAAPIPRWYVATDEQGRIVGGCGLIQNDFIERTDLFPYLCALYVEKEARGHALGGRLLDFVRRDAGRLGIEKLYLCTDHTSYYERYGWRYLTDAKELGGGVSRIYVAETPTEAN